MKVIKVSKYTKGSRVLSKTTRIAETDIKATVAITGGQSLPEDGIWWYINNQWIVFSDEVPATRTLTISGGYLHKVVWNEISDGFKVDGNIVDYQYFPRGRVTVVPQYDENGNFTKFDCKLYGDKCVLSNQELVDKIYDYFKLYLGTCTVEIVGDWFVDGSHYTCNKCKK